MKKKKKSPKNMTLFYYIISKYTRSQLCMYAGLWINESQKYENHNRELGMWIVVEELTCFTNTTNQTLNIIEFCRFDLSDY